MTGSSGGLALIALAAVIGWLWWSGTAASFLAALLGKVAPRG